MPTILPPAEEAIGAIQASVKFVNKHFLSSGIPVKYVHVSVRCIKVVYFISFCHPTTLRNG